MIDGLPFTFAGDSFEIRGRGTVITITLDDYPNVTQGTLAALVGQTFETPEGRFTIRAVESMAGIRIGRHAGLLVKKDDVQRCPMCKFLHSPGLPCFENGAER